MSAPGRRRILVVDDEGDIVELIRVNLAPFFEVDTALDGPSALALAHGRGIAYDAVVLDLSMPVMSGWEVLEALRADERTEQLPVLVLTALGDRQVAVDSYVSGCHAFHRKPFDPDHLRAALQDLMTRSPQARELNRLQKIVDLGE